MSVNLDDPSTWPETLDGIEALAADTIAPDRRQGFVESEPPAEAPAAADGAGPDAPAGAAEPELVLMADGTHAAPYSTLKEARQQAQAARDEANRLREELASLRQGGQPQGEPEGQEGAAETLEERIARARARYEAVREDDPELADAYELGLLALEQQAQMRAERQAEIDRALATEVQASQADIQAAIEGNPVLSQWMQDDVWSARARGMERVLMQDPQSAYGQAKDWAGRFAAVVMATEAAYGPSPATASLRRVQTQGGVHAPVYDTPRMPVPPSMSAMQGGMADLPGEEIAALERMSPADMMAHLNRLAEKGALEDLIARVSG